jgi:ribosome maturation factor RimP
MTLRIRAFSDSSARFGGQYRCTAAECFPLAAPPENALRGPKFSLALRYKLWYKLIKLSALLKKRASLPAFFLEAARPPKEGRMERETIDKVFAVADPILTNAGMELVDVEYRREARGWVLRLFIDKEGGVTVDDCTRISQEVGRVLDVEDFILTAYVLEVSSPGLNRTLKREKDFMKYRDHLIRVKTLEPIENRRQFKGKLLSVSENRIQMEVDGKNYEIPLPNVAKANLEFEF